MKTTMAATLALGLLGICGHAQQAPPAPDNTKVNQRDRSKDAPTADQAKNTTTDRDTMQKIRKAIMADKGLSTYAHNVKVISQGGKVTLKGPVRSEEEKTSVEQKATEVAGAGNVTNEITVKPDTSKKKS
ncbi:MAG: BON domain-containing protein [Candidatus Solibacter sp.]